MAKVTASEYQEKHARRLKEATVDMANGVSKVTTSPMAKAADKAEKMKTNLVKAIDSGKWQAGLKNVTLEQWKDKMINKGIPRIAQGIDDASEKVTAFAEKLLPYIDKGVAEVKKMPDITLEHSIARSTQFIRHMANFKK